MEEAEKLDPPLTSHACVGVRRRRRRRKTPKIDHEKFSSSAPVGYSVGPVGFLAFSRCTLLLLDACDDISAHDNPSVDMSGLNQRRRRA